MSVILAQTEIMVTTTDSLSRLKEIGFRLAGRWVLDAGEPRFSLNSVSTSENLLYAFVVDGKVMYIGKTVRPLKKRMYGYQNPGPTQHTNIAGHNNILKILLADQTIEIYTLIENGLLQHGGFKVNLAAGVEDTLIREFRPLWNKLGK